MNNKIIPYVNLIDQHAPIKEELLNAVSKVIDSGQFILGQEVENFEAQVAKLCRTRFAVSVNSGTDALVLALLGLGIGPGDEVITVPNSFIASTSCIMLVGATPVFVDVGEDYNMNPALIEDAITPKTKAVLPVHLTGRPANMTAILEVTDKHHLIVVEDCAQAILAEHKNQRVGSFGQVGGFSLHPLKTLNACGDGGILTTDDAALYDQLKIRRNLGLKTRDDCMLWSANSRLDTMQAAILGVKLHYLHQWTEKRRSNAQFYFDKLSDVTNIDLPYEQVHEKAVYHTFVIQADRRDALKQFLAEHGVGSSIHYPVPIHLQSAALSLGYKVGSFPVTEKQAERILSLPIYPELTQSDLMYVVETIKRFYAN